MIGSSNKFFRRFKVSAARFQPIRIDSKALPLLLFKLPEMLEEMDKSIALINEWPYNALPRVSELLDDMERARSICENLGEGRVVLCHNDPNQKNLLYSDEEGLSFIDFGKTL